MNTELLRQIHIKDLRIGDILVNIGCVVRIEEYANVFRVRTSDECRGFSKSQSVIVKRNINE